MNSVQKEMINSMKNSSDCRLSTTMKRSYGSFLLTMAMHNF